MEQISWDRVARYLEQKASEHQNEANQYAVMKDQEQRALRHDTLAAVARLLAGSLRFGLAKGGF